MPGSQAALKRARDALEGRSGDDAAKDGGAFWNGRGDAAAEEADSKQAESKEAQKEAAKKKAAEEKARDYVFSNFFF